MSAPGWFRLGDFPSAVPLRRVCWRKERHQTIGAAEAQARSLTRRGLDGDGVRGYACPSCGGFHVGHPPGADKAWKR